MSEKRDFGSTLAEKRVSWYPIRWGLDRICVGSTRPTIVKSKTLTFAPTSPPDFLFFSSNTDMDSFMIGIWAILSQ